MYVVLSHLTVLHAGQVPVDRQISYMVASNLYTDSEELLRNLHLAPYLKPVVSLIDDFPQQQRHKGWQFGYAVAKDNYDQVGSMKHVRMLLWADLAADRCC